MVSVTVEGPRLGTFALGRSLFNRICILTRSPTPAELGAADTTGSVVVGPVRNDAIPKSQKLRLRFTVGNWNVCVNSATAGYGSLGANRLDWSFHTLEGHSDRDNISHLFRWAGDGSSEGYPHLADSTRKNCTAKRRWVSRLLHCGWLEMAASTASLRSTASPGRAPIDGMAWVF